MLRILYSGIVTASNMDEIPYLGDSGDAADTNGACRRPGQCRRSLWRHEAGGDGAGVLLGHVIPEAEAGKEVVAVAGATAAGRGGGDELVGLRLQVVGHADLQGGPERKRSTPLLTLFHRKL